MQASRIVEHFNVLEDGELGLGVNRKQAPMNRLLPDCCFQQYPDSIFQRDFADIDVSFPTLSLTSV